ncbi:MAG: formyltransferase family protein [Planctomycetota bacterium]|jgi:methionyl-tRNA formyltransferase
MKILLFSNERYGLPFIETAARFAHVHRVRVRVVLSAARWRVPTARRLVSAVRKRHRLGLPVTIAADVNNERFRGSIGPFDCGVIAGFNQIMSQATLGRFRSLVNFHPSLLPYYRGPAPSHWCLVNGETTSGFTLHEVTSAIDAGPILHQQAVPVEPGDDEDDLNRRIARAGAEVMWRWLEHLHTGTVWPKEHLDAHLIYQSHVEYASFPA